MALALLLLSIFSKSTKMETSFLSWVEKISVSIGPTNEQDEFWHSEELLQSIGGVVFILKELVCSVFNSFKYSSEKFSSFSIRLGLVTSALTLLLLSIFYKSTKMETSSQSWVEKSLVSLDPINEQDEFWHSEEMVPSAGGVVSILQELICSVANRFKYSSEKFTSFSIRPAFVISA